MRNIALIVSGLTLASVTTAQAGVFWVDVNDADLPASSKWNSVDFFSESSPATAQGPYVLAAETGPETISIENVTISNNDRGFHTEKEIDLVPTWVDEVALHDYVWLFDNNGDGTVTLAFDLTGLNDTSTYDIEIWSAREDNGSENMDVTINGTFSQGDVSNDFNWGNEGLIGKDTSGDATTMLWTGLSPNAGKLSVLLDGSTSRIGINAMRITEVVPEPTSVALLALGGLLIGIRRR